MRLRNAPSFRLLVASLIPLLLTVAGCTPLAANAPGMPQTTVFPASDAGRLIQNLYELIFVMAVVVFVGVEGFLLYTVIRFRRRREGELPAQVHGNTRLEITWTVLPSIVLLIIAIPTIGTIFAQDVVPPTATDVLKLKVVGHQWWWEIRYPEYGSNVVTANEFHLPRGRTVLVELTSADVVHSFWVPKMGGKMDVVPTRVTHLWFTPEETGEFLGQCVEFCGIQHANMRLRLFVDPPDQFEAWVKQQGTDAARPTSVMAREGGEVFERNACVGCHTIRGTEAQGAVGPDLTHVAGRTTIAAGVLRNTPDQLARWIQDPQGVKGGAKMPNLPLSGADVAALVAYLQTLE